jgi:hypothetical protein
LISWFERWSIRHYGRRIAYTNASGIITYVDTGSVTIFEGIGSESEGTVALRKVKKATGVSHSLLFSRLSLVYIGLVRFVCDWARLLLNLAP